MTFALLIHRGWEYDRLVPRVHLDPATNAEFPRKRKESMTPTIEPEARLIDIDAANARVNAALHPQAQAAVPGRTRAPRRDKGTTRAPKPATSAGALTEQQAAEIERLTQDVVAATVNARGVTNDANATIKRASQALHSYLGALQAGEAL